MDDDRIECVTEMNVTDMVLYDVLTQNCIVLNCIRSDSVPWV